MAMMKLALFISFISFIVSCSSETTMTATINGWCTQTPHYQTCKHYIANPNPSTTPISINQFLHITIQAAIDEARLVLKRTQGIEPKYPNVPGKGLWRSCVDYFDGIVFTLNTVLDHDHNLKPTSFDVQTWLSAGLAYINTCEKGFELINMTNTMLPKITNNLTQLILNSLAISVVIRGDNTPGLVDLNFINGYNLRVLDEESPDVVVAQDGSGNFDTIQEAIDSATSGSESKRYVIYIKEGVYEEYIHIQDTLEYIKMFGDGINKTIITGYRHCGGDMLVTAVAGDLKSSSTFQVWSRGFIARDITFRNTAGPEGGQAIALLSASDQSTFYRCSFEGYQDTLFTYHKNQFYKECQIFGTVDFIFGDAQVVFQDCEIFLRKPLPGGGLVVTAHGRKFNNESTAYSLQRCKITAADDLKPIIGQFKKAYLGRPWFPKARVVVMQTFLDDLIHPRGWLDNRGFNKTAYCGEYQNDGPGSSTDERVDWRNYHVITDSKIAKKFTVAKLISGDLWLPETGVPFIPGLENV